MEEEKKPIVDMSQPQQNQEPEIEPVVEEKGSGAVLGSIIVIVVLVIAAFFIWSNNSEAPSEVVSDLDLPDGTTEVVSEDGEAVVDEATEDLLEVNESDELEVIMEDLEATNLDDLTGELDDIEAELDSEEVVL